MPNFPNNLFAYKHFAFAAVLALGLGACEQHAAVPVSAAPIAPMPAARYYLNAKPSLKEVIEQLDPQTITRLEVLDNQQAATYAQDPSVKRVILAQTR